METIAIIILSLLVGYGLGRLHSARRLRKIRQQAANAKLIHNELVEASDQLSRQYSGLQRISSQKDAIFENLLEICINSLDIAQITDQQRQELSAELAELRAQHERTLATFN